MKPGLSSLSSPRERATTPNIYAGSSKNIKPMAPVAESSCDSLCRTTLLSRPTWINLLGQKRFRMQATLLEPHGLVLIRFPIYKDARGFFMERYQQERFREHGLPCQFVQDNHSRSIP